MESPSSLVSPGSGLTRRRIASLVGAGLLARFGMARAEPTLRLARLENVPDQALGAEILTAVYRRLGIPVVFVDLPAKRSLLESSEGRVDGEVQRILAVQTQYPTLVALQPSFNYIEPSAFVKDLALRVEGWPSLAPHSVGIVRGVGSSEAGTRGMARVEAVSTMDQLMQALAAGRYEVAVNDRFSGLLIIQRLGLGKVLRVVDPPLQHIPLHHFLHERHRALVPRVEQELRNMQGSGELQRVRQEAVAAMLRVAQR
ncbi:substrate-binding periplasmic protein [Aquabacterium sp.]|uniref:substrate-binding periplasmic protein n=1 Tax=Aquabacterium sp. TaxID=1872578 RepID=UPI002D11F03A|nr:transporter substrate-binding domain-containing protein [Aquabacterium sp.]HSW05083.1 transporter substrate-binding domain-containing protein [Aquabacterium sp.]